MKVRCVDNKGFEFPGLIVGKTYTVEKINAFDSYVLKELPQYNIWRKRFEIIIEDKKNISVSIEKNIREVMRDIKEDEVWSSDNFFIYINERGLCISRNDYVLSTDWCLEKEKFILQSELYSFQEAFEAYENGKEIKSAVSGKIAFRNELDEKIQFSVNEIKGKWYVNDIPSNISF